MCCNFKTVVFSPCTLSRRVVTHANSSICPQKGLVCLRQAGSAAEWRHYGAPVQISDTFIHEPDRQRGHVRKISSPSFTKTNKPSIFPPRNRCFHAIDNISVPNYCLRSVARCMIELYNIFISAEFVSHCICELVTYFSASLAPTSSFVPWAALRRERDLEGVQTYVSLSLTIKEESFLWSTSLGQ